MSVLSVKALRSWVKSEMTALFGSSYSVFDSRLRPIDTTRLPVIVVGILSGAEDDSAKEDITIRVQVTHGAKAVDFVGDATDSALMDRVEDDVYRIRNRFQQSDVADRVGHLSRCSWDYSGGDDGNILAAWANVDLTFERRIFWTDDDAEPVEFDTVMLDTEIADTGIEITTGVDL